MAASPITLLGYADMRKRQRTHILRQSEIPIEHAVSLPLPTKRWLGPAYAFFAAPTLRLQGRPIEQGAPDRWWVVDAHGGRLIVYALSRAMSFAEERAWTTVELPPVKRTIAELQAAETSVEVLMDAVVGGFFADAAGDAATCRALSEALAAYLPSPIIPQYRALAPDFFAWLEA